MASKIPELTARAAVRDVDAEPGMLVTPGMVDDAVEKVLRGRPPAESEALIAAWASDQSSELGQMLQGSIAARASRLKAYETVSKSPVTVNYSISDDAKKEMMARHPDMDIIFNPSVHHDHALAAAERKVASVKLHSRVPAGMRYVDFGGSLLMHVEQGNLSVMVVGGIHDSKDPARDTLVNMRLRQLARSDTVRPQVRHMAQSVLAGDGKYFQRGTLEEFTGDFKVGVMSHVYDVKLTSIPAMMDRCGMKLFEGVMHYSPRFHLEDEGELESVGARFKVQDGTFMMGFVDSPSLWYTHDWNEFMHYGIDQIMTVNGTSYSYRVHERRGDSISFRLMPAGIGRFDEQTRLFNPDIPVVEVSSYDAPVSGRSSDLVSVKRRYPTDVWDRMVRAAMLDALKGTLDVNNHVLSYKNITAGHMYNGVSTISRKVGTCDVPWVVVDSALYALAHVMLFRRGVGAFVDAEMKRRAVLDSNIIELGAKTFVQALTAVVTAPFLPLKWLGDALMTSAQAMVGRLIEVAPVARYVTIKALPYSRGMLGGIDPTDATALMMRFALDNKALDDAVDKLLLEAKEEESSMPSAEHYNVNISGTDYNANVVGSAYTHSKAGDALEIPSWVPVDEPVPGVPDQYERMEQHHTQGDRTAAVQEAISCAQAEATELETWCRSQFEKFCSGGRTPTSREVREASERNRDLDFWHVQHGVIMNSVSGNTEDDMASGGVYCPSPIQVVGPDGIKVYTHLIAVKEATYDDGKRHRVHFVMDADYTGLVLTCKDLVVFNGAQLVAGLTTALALPHVYEMGGVLGGPGCGKTHSIVKLFKRGNMVVTPLKESAKDVRTALVKAGMLSAGAAHKVVRTLDSILCAAGRSPEAAAALHSADRVLVDECFNALPGRYYAVLGLLKARTVVVFGDNRQIPPVVRANVNLMYVYMRYMHSVNRYLNFRCAPEVLACFSGHYGDKLRAVRREKGVVVLNEGVYVDIPAGRDVLLLVMNQADKNKLVRMFPAYKSSVRTTHEAQGKQADEVYLFNLETRQISDANPNYLYFKDDYVNVAISRARNKFVYAFSSTYGDKVKEWIARGSSPSLVRALTDTSTAGTAAFF